MVMRRWCEERGTFQDISLAVGWLWEPSPQLEPFGSAVRLLCSLEVVLYLNNFIPLFAIFFPSLYFNLFSRSQLFLLSIHYSFAGVSSKVIVITERGGKKAWRGLFTAIFLGSEINVHRFQQYLISSGSLTARSLHYLTSLHKGQRNRKAFICQTPLRLLETNAFQSLSSLSFGFFFPRQTEKAVDLLITCLSVSVWHLQPPVTPSESSGIVHSYQIIAALAIYLFSQEDIVLPPAWVRTIKGCCEIFQLLRCCNMNWNEMIP